MQNVIYSTGGHNKRKRNRLGGGWIMRGVSTLRNEELGVSVTTESLLVADRTLPGKKKCFWDVFLADGMLAQLLNNLPVPMRDMLYGF
ncbi:hypothetical protein GWI33_006083 [Rhynchophorus ferrugineus]|uniref:Uncharacterized protein n=1 Tax=Rhynchophorus ferrugineus TaxID=354439 RepID=A0A834IJP4_RHYFE|nr:hypothetical protein GWI33_006083 [Rhynchophorus ferrugineus]